MDYLANFIIWAIAVYGTALVITQSTLMQPVREWITYSKIEHKDNDITKVLRKWQLPGKLINCIMCTGWWSGAFWSYFGWNPAMFDSNIVLNTIFAGMLGCAATWIFAVFMAPKQKGM